MSSTARHVHYTYAEYISLEDESSVRHEYLDGEIYAMAGGSPDHAALAFSALALLRAPMPRSCRGFTSDLRVRTQTGLATYPDGAIVCGRTMRASDDPLAVTNPSILIEVTSPSTEDYDRGEKLRHYKSIPSVREILIVSHREPLLTVHRRGDDGQWSTGAARTGESVHFPSVAATLSVDEVYSAGLEDANQPLTADSEKKT